MPTSSESRGPLAVRISGLGKSYTISHQTDQPATLSEALARRLRKPFAKPTTETFWALRDVTLDIQRGEVVGVVGRNGAGKSTLFKILSRITEPTEGEVEMYGRVGSLLEVGTGFHPELTGRENIFLNGAILGMRRAEIARHFDEIVEFAEIERFLDTPVKRYSSGMYVRLAFAVAAHLEPEILIVDEVLAVGDAAFQAKCLGKIKDVARGGDRTVLFVSHNMNAVATLCNRAIVMDRGRVTFAGATAKAIEMYGGSGQLEPDLDLSKCPRRSPTTPIIFRRLEVRDAADRPTAKFGAMDEVRLLITIGPDSPLADARIGLGMNDARGDRVCVIASYLGSGALGPVSGTRTFECRFNMPPLIPGRYTFDATVADGASRGLDGVDVACTLELLDTNYLDTAHPYFPEMGRMLVKSQWARIAE